MKTSTSIILGFILMLIYYQFQPTGAYGVWPTICADLGIIPVIVMVIRLIKTKSLTTGIMTIVVFQTWNMFLNPYLWEEKIVAMHRVINEAHIPAMAFFSMLSVWALMAGFLTIESRRHKPSIIFRSSKIETATLGKYATIGIVIGFIVSVAEFIIDNLGIKTSFLSMLTVMLPTTVLCLISLYYIRGGRNPILIAIVGIYVIYNFIYYVGGTLFIYSIILLMAPFAVYVVETKKIPVKGVIVATILLLPIYMSRHDYRREGLYTSGTERIQVGLKILEEEYVHFDMAKNRDRINESQDNINEDNRFEGVSYLATVVHCHEDLNYPMQWGKTFVWLPTMFVPRFLLPIRPSQNMGDDWAEYYLVKEPSWKASINFPMLVEFYADFGFLGMIIMSFFQGMFIAWICAKFNNGVGDINLLFLVFLMPKLIVIEANVTLAYGIIVQILFLIWLFRFIHVGRVTPAKKVTK